MLRKFVFLGILNLGLIAFGEEEKAEVCENPETSSLTTQKPAAVENSATTHVADSKASECCGGKDCADGTKCCEKCDETKQ